MTLIDRGLQKQSNELLIGCLKAFVSSEDVASSLDNNSDTELKAIMSNDDSNSQEVDESLEDFLDSLERDDNDLLSAMVSSSKENSVVFDDPDSVDAMFAGGVMGGTDYDPPLKAESKSDDLDSLLGSSGTSIPSATTHSSPADDDDDLDSLLSNGGTSVPSATTHSSPVDDDDDLDSLLSNGGTSVPSATTHSSPVDDDDDLDSLLGSSGTSIPSATTHSSQVAGSDFDSSEEKKEQQANSTDIDDVLSSKKRKGQFNIFGGKVSAFKNKKGRDQKTEQQVTNQNEEDPLPLEDVISDDAVRERANQEIEKSTGRENNLTRKNKRAVWKPLCALLIMSLSAAYYIYNPNLNIPFDFNFNKTAEYATNSQLNEVLAQNELLRKQIKDINSKFEDVRFTSSQNKNKIESDNHELSNNYSSLKEVTENLATTIDKRFVKLTDFVTLVSLDVKGVTQGQSEVKERLFRESKAMVQKELQSLVADNSLQDFEGKANDLESKVMKMSSKLDSTVMRLNMVETENNYLRGELKKYREQSNSSNDEDHQRTSAEINSEPKPSQKKESDEFCCVYVELPNQKVVEQSKQATTSVKDEKALSDVHDSELRLAGALEKSSGNWEIHLFNPHEGMSSLKQYSLSTHHSDKVPNYGHIVNIVEINDPTKALPYKLILENGSIYSVDKS